MNFEDIKVPEVYKRESADFRFFLEWIKICLTHVKYDIEEFFDLYDPLRCKKELLWMLADTMGFKYDDRLPHSYNRLVLLYFMSMIRNKGSKDGVTLAAEVNLAQFNILDYGKENEIWIAWFGILPKFRRQNIATQTIKDFCEFWRKKGYNNLRLYSYCKKFYKPAINFYRKNMDIEENYNYNYKNEKILIFTKNLNKSHYEKWNNKDIFYYSDKLEEKSSLVLWKSIYGENYGKKN